MGTSFKTLYTDPDGPGQICAALQALTAGNEKDAAIICIGTDSNIADSLGPMVGTFLTEWGISLPVIGTLDNPLHAKNMKERMAALRSNTPAPFEIAVDASLGKREDVGLIELKDQGLYPGRALLKSLPLVGRVSILAKVGVLSGIWRQESLPEIRLSTIYSMARAIAAGIHAWDPGRSV